MRSEKTFWFLNLVKELAEEFDERDPAVALSIAHVIRTCRKRHVTVSICGQAPSIYPQLTQQLVEWGITSISVNPDAIDATRKIIYEAEEKHLRRKS